VSQLQCPNCGYRSDDGDFQVDKSGTADANDPAKPSALMTPADGTPKKAGFSPQQVTVKGMASSRGGIELARRAPVTSLGDMLVSRTAGGPAVIRHRQGGAQIAEMRHNDDGTWQSVVDGKALTPHTRQQAALMEALGTWNRSAAMPLQQPPAQPAALAALGVTNVRAFASDDSDDDDDDPDGGSDDNGLTPRGQQIHMKLKKKGVAPKVALAMAKRAQTTTPGQFGNKGS
jgi:hypothetical protein